MLLKVTNDILMKVNSQEVTLLVMLDLSHAFDMVNHDILISRLHEEVGVSGLALEWFRSYLQNRTQRVAVDRTFSERFVLDHRAPAWAHCCSSFTRPSYSRSSAISYQKHTATQTIHNYICVLSRIALRRRLLLLMLWSVE